MIETNMPTETAALPSEGGEAVMALKTVWANQAHLDPDIAAVIVVVNNDQSNPISTSLLPFSAASLEAYRLDEDDDIVLKNNEEALDMLHSITLSALKSDHESPEVHVEHITGDHGRTVLMMEVNVHGLGTSPTALTQAYWSMLTEDLGNDRACAPLDGPSQPTDDPSISKDILHYKNLDRHMVRLAANALERHAFSHRFTTLPTQPSMGARPRL